MRDLFLVVVVVMGVGVTFRFPFVGLLIWEWFSMMSPHQEAFGFARSLPLNMIVAGSAILSWLVSEEPKKIPLHSITILFLIFIGWMTFNSFFAYNTTWSWVYWDRTWRVFALGFLMAAMTTNRVRIDAIVWVAALSLMYYGVKGGIFTTFIGGGNRVYGPENTIIADNNQLALALLMSLPLIEYLRTSISSKLISMLLIASMVWITISVLGSYSRGAYVAMAAIAVFFLIHTRRRFLYLVVGTIVIAVGLRFMPQEFFDRVNSINSVDTDSSFQGRVMAWQVAFRYASDHFPFGAGFYGPQLSGIFSQYFPGETSHAAHSIYFQVLGEQGFIGLIIYLAIIFMSFKYCWAILRKTKKSGDLETRKLVRMIQTSLLAFYVGGAALSMAYYDLFVILVFLLPPLLALSPEGIVVAKEKWRAGTKTGDGPPISPAPALSRGEN